MDSNTALEQVKNLYTNNILQYGKDPLSVGWRTVESQTLRFEKLTNGLPLDQQITVNELGCGYGAMYDYLQAKLSGNLKLYRGFDISEEMLKEAQNHIGNQPNVELLLESQMKTDADFSFTSGIFNVRFEANDLVWEKHILATLENMNEASSRGFSFNLLTSYVDYREPHLYYGDPCFFFDYCKKRFSKKVSLIHDYALWEWTIVVRKD